MVVENAGTSQNSVEREVDYVPQTRIFRRIFMCFAQVAMQDTEF